MSKLKRPSMLLFLKIDENFCLCGVYSDELTIEYNPQTETNQDVTEEAASTDVTGYQISVPVSAKVVAAEGQKGYKVSNYIQGLRRNLATTGDAETEALLVDTYAVATTPAGSFVAQKFKAVIQIDTYGGPANESLGIEYTVHLNGTPETGTAKVTTDPATSDKTATYTAPSAPEAG